LFHQHQKRQLPLQRMCLECCREHSQANMIRSLRSRAESRLMWRFHCYQC